MGQASDRGAKPKRKFSWGRMGLGDGGNEWLDGSSERPKSEAETQVFVGTEGLGGRRKRTARWVERATEERSRNAGFCMDEWARGTEETNGSMGRASDQGAKPKRRFSWDG